MRFQFGRSETCFVRLRRYDPLCWSAAAFQLTVLDQERERLKGHFNADFSQFQEILRHSNHISEVINVTVGTTEEMRKCRKKILHRNPGNMHDEKLLQDRTHYHMAFQTQLIRNLRLRQQSNQDRLQSEITLVRPHH